MKKHRKQNCTVCNGVLESAEVTLIVSKKVAPKDAMDIASTVLGKAVCLKCGGTLRRAGFRTFNLAESRQRQKEREKRESMATIRELIESKGGKPDAVLPVTSG